MTYPEEKTKFDQFLALNEGKQVIVLPSSQQNGYGQCFDLATAWTNLLGIPHYPGNPSPFPYANAHDIYDSFGTFQTTYFDRIANSDTFVPIKGDIGVYASSLNGGAGDVFICTGVGDTNTFQGFNQNWSPRQPATLITHNYNHFLGVLRLKVTTATMDNRNGEFDVFWHGVDDPNADTTKVTYDQVNAKIAWIKSNIHRASMYDQVCKLAGLTGDTNKIAAQEVKNALQQSDHWPVNKNKIISYINTL